jgi:hypothetical protein
MKAIEVKGGERLLAPTKGFGQCRIDFHSYIYYFKLAQTKTTTHLVQIGQ